MTHLFIIKCLQKSKHLMKCLDINKFQFQFNRKMEEMICLFCKKFLILITRWRFPKHKSSEISFWFQKKVFEIVFWL
jgi:hypothetical protein